MGAAFLLLMVGAALPFCVVVSAVLVGGVVSARALSCVARCRFVHVGFHGCLIFDVLPSWFVHGV